MSDEEISARRPVSGLEPVSGSHPGDAVPQDSVIAAHRPLGGPAEEPAARPARRPGRQPRSASRVRASLPRAARLLAMTTFLPGRAQVAAGPRKLGRAALLVTLACWVLLVLTVLGLLLARGTVLNILLNPVVSGIITAVLVALGIGWALLYLFTLRAAKPGNLGLPAGIGVALATLCLMAVTSGTLFAGANALGKANAAFSEIFFSGEKAQPDNGRYNILLLGGDGGTDRTGRRPDSISVMSIVAATGDTVSFAIPRNLQNAPFPEGSPLREVYPEGYNCGDSCIINTLYGLVNEKYRDLYPGVEDPGAQAMMEAASGILGIRVSSYALVDMGGFSEMVDAVGGVTVNSGGWVPVTSGEILGTDPIRHYPPSEWMAPGTLTLDGYHAEWYARSREFTSDYNRIKRQQCIQSALLQRLSPLTIATRFGAITTASADLLESNIARSQVGTFLDAALKSRGNELRRLTIGEPDFEALFSTYPDFERVHSKVQEVISQGSSASASSGGSSLVLGAATVRTPASLAGLTAETTPSPAVTGPNGEKITPEYLHSLAEKADDATLSSLLSNNGECTPAS